MKSDHEELQTLLQDANEIERGKPRRVPEEAVLAGKQDILEHSQWEVLPNGVFAATGTTNPRLAPGAYTIAITETGRTLFVSKKILTDQLIDLGNSNSLHVIDGIRLFWTKKEQYKRRGILYKRGVLLWGPAGSGKTATLSLLVADLIKMGGIVLLVQSPALATRALPVLRKIEPDRPLIVIIEDIEEIIQASGEHDLLALLDGEHQTDNVVNLATTNYPEQLGARIINRPSRFDEVQKIGMPSPIMRKQYLVHILRDEVGKFPVDRWVEDTEGMSIAHLKELVVAVTCLDQTYENVIARLKTMKTAPKSSMYDTNVGFGASGASKSSAPRPAKVGY